MLGHPALVLVQARLFRPVENSRRSNRAFLAFRVANTQPAQSGFAFDLPHHVLVKSGVESQFETKSSLGFDFKNPVPANAGVALHG